MASKGLKKARCVRKKMAEGKGITKARKVCGVKKPKGKRK